VGAYEDLGGLLLVHIDNPVDTDSTGASQRDDSARRGIRVQIDAIEETELGVKLADDYGREHTADSSAVARQDATRVVRQ